MLLATLVKEWSVLPSYHTRFEAGSSSNTKFKTPGSPFERLLSPPCYRASYVLPGQLIGHVCPMQESNLLYSITHCHDRNIISCVMRNTLMGHASSHRGIEPPQPCCSGHAAFTSMRHGTDYGTRTRIGHFERVGTYSG